MLSEVELEDILGRLGTEGPPSSYESSQLEFKQTSDHIKKTLNDLASASVCFANAGGGTIVVGVNDRARTRQGALFGVPPTYSIEIIRKGIFDRTKPPLTPFATEHIEAGVRLVIVEVPQSSSIHSNNAGTATRRMGKECRPFTPDQQRDVLIARGQVDWSAESSKLTIDRLSSGEFDRLRRLLRTAGRDELAALRNKPLLEALHLVGPDGFATHAAVLMLADPETIREVLPNHEYSYQYRSTPGSEATFRLREAKPLLSAIDELMKAVERRTELLPLNLAGGVQLQLADYPLTAVREVVVNALLHRSYDESASVDLEHSPESLVIASPGGFVAGVTPENILTHPSTPRHRSLSEAISLLQLAEKTGQGIDRAYREMLRAGKSPPHFEDSGFAVRAILPGGTGNDVFVRFINELPDELGRDVDVLLALSLLRDSSSITAQQLATVIQRTQAEAQRVLARLASEELPLLEPTRRTARRAFPSYRLRSEPLAALSRAVAYQRRTWDQIDAKVIEHIQEYGFVTNATLQRLFDLNLYRARDVLTDLRRRNVIKKLGEARGGPGVRYGPGPNFPRDKKAARARVSTRRKS